MCEVETEGTGFCFVSSQTKQLVLVITMVQQQFCNSGIMLTHQNHLFCHHWKLLLFTFQILLGRPPHISTMYHLTSVNVQPSPSIRLACWGWPWGWCQPNSVTLQTQAQTRHSQPVHRSPHWKCPNLPQKYPNRYKEDIPSWNSPLSYFVSRTRAP